MRNKFPICERKQIPFAPQCAKEMLGLAQTQTSLHFIFLISSYVLFLLFYSGVT